MSGSILLGAVAPMIRTGLIVLVMLAGVAGNGRGDFYSGDDLFEARENFPDGCVGYVMASMTRCQPCERTVGPHAIGDHVCQRACRESRSPTSRQNL